MKQSARDKVGMRQSVRDKVGMRQSVRDKVGMRQSIQDKVGTSWQESLTGWLPYSLLTQGCYTQVGVECVPPCRPHQGPCRRYDLRVLDHPVCFTGMLENSDYFVLVSFPVWLEEEAHRATSGGRPGHRGKNRPQKENAGRTCCRSQRRL